MQPQVATDGKPCAYIIPGFHDWYSDGLFELQSLLRVCGVKTTDVPEAQYAKLQHVLLAAPPTPVVLIGFSYGADDVITIARALDSRGRKVALLILIDPVTPAAIPPNVSRCVDYYQSNGLWDLLPFLRGVPVRRGAGDNQPLSNVNLRRTPNLLEPNTSHATITSNERVHAAIVEQVAPTYHLEP